MSEVIGRGVVEVSADATKLNAGIEQAKQSIKGLGIATQDATKSSSASIDRYIRSLGVAAVTAGKSARETELYKLALRGATAEQLKAADAALKMSAAQEQGDAIRSRLKLGLFALAGAATAAGGAWVNMIANSINVADNLNDLSKKTGISVEDLSGLSLAAQQSGTDLDGLAASINKLSKNIGTDPEKFRALGVTAKDPIEAFKQLAEIFRAIDDPQTRAALGAAALGKSWESAAPVLAEGADAIGQMIDKGKRLSGITQELASNADALNDQFTEFKAVTAGLGTKMAGEMLPALNSIAAAVLRAYEESGKLAAAWTLLGSFGAFVFTDEFTSDANKLKALGTELDELNQKRKEYDERSMGGFFSKRAMADINTQVTEVTAKITALQDKLTAAKNKPVEVKPEPDPKLAKAVRGFIGAEGDTGAKAAAATAHAEAKAQLALDISSIKTGGQAQADAFAGAERLMQAQHSAALISDAEYYDAKLGFLRLNASAQEQTLLDEIARLSREKLAGKDRIDNEKAIGIARAALAKVQTSAVIDTIVLDTEKATALDKVKQSYLDASIAAQTYLATVQTQNAREVAGIGQGNKARANNAGLNGIEDKQTTQRQGLERDLRNNQITKAQYDDYLQIVTDTYAQEVELYNARTSAISAKQGDWMTGISEAMANYRDDAANMADQTAQVWGNATKGMEDALVNFAMTGKLNFSSLANSIIADIIRIQARQATSQLLSSLISSFAGGSSGATGVAAEGGYASVAGISGGRAIGGPVSAGGLYPVNERGSPEILTMGGRDYLMTGTQGGTVQPQSQAGPAAAPIIFNIGAGVTRNELAAMVPELKKQIKAEMMNTMRRPGYAG